MTATFSPDLDDAVSRVRQFIGDTDKGAALVQDETIEAYLATKSELGAAAQLAFDLSAKYARMATKETVDRQTVDYSGLATAFENLGKRLALQDTGLGSSTLPAPSQPPVGGLILTGGDTPVWDPARILGVYTAPFGLYG